VVVRNPQLHTERNVKSVEEAGGCEEAPVLHVCVVAGLGGSRWRVSMALRIVCMCGYVIQGGDDDELWRNAQRHMAVLHPELVGNVTREDILAQAELL
jgi:hypothetical protein